MAHAASLLALCLDRMKAESHQLPKKPRGIAGRFIPWFHPVEFEPEKTDSRDIDTRLQQIVLPPDLTTLGTTTILGQACITDPTFRDASPLKAPKMILSRVSKIVNTPVAQA